MTGVSCREFHDRHGQPAERSDMDECQHMWEARGLDGFWAQSRAAGDQRELQHRRPLAKRQRDGQWYPTASCHHGLHTAGRDRDYAL